MPDGRSEVADICLDVVIAGDACGAVGPSDVAVKDRCREEGADALVGLTHDVEIDVGCHEAEINQGLVPDAGGVEGDRATWKIGYSV